MQHSSAVPAPWTPIALTHDQTRLSLSVWGRTYTWDHSLFPVSIRTADRELLHAPMTLSATFDGEPAQPIHTAITLLSQAEDTVSFVVSQSLGSILINARYIASYDGYLDVSLGLIPFWGAAGALPRLDNLHIDICLKNPSASLYHYWPNSSIGTTPDPTIIASGAVPDSGVQTSFKPYFWLGWEFGGLGIASESDEQIRLAEGTPVFSVQKEPEYTRLRYRLLDQTPRLWENRSDAWANAMEPVYFPLGIQATPVKPLRPDRHDFRILHIEDDTCLDLDTVDENGDTMLDRYVKLGITHIIFHEAWSAIQNWGLAVDEARFLRCVDACHQHGLKAMAYFGYEFATNAPTFPEKREEYLLKTAQGHYAGGWQRANPCQRDYMVCYAGGYAEELRERVRFAMTHYHLDGIYTDGMHEPFECANAAHGCGYTDAQGVRHTTFPIRALRRHAEALYRLVHELGGTIDTHQSSCLVAPTLSFADSFYNGENIQAKLSENFIEFLNLPAFRCEYMGKNLGLFPQFLASISEKMPMEKALALTLLHDVFPRPNVEETAAILSPYWKAFRDFGAGSALWHPYWDNALITCNDPAVFCSAYEKEDAVLAVLVSFAPETHTARLQYGNETLEIQLPPCTAVLRALPRKS